jgi:hypothetical protein
MPPRHTYWTIILEGKPTAFRAHASEELLPTLRQLQAKHPDAVMKWFARGRLWDSPEAERAAAAARAPDRRGPGWRPGGAHRDPRERFKIPRDEKRRRFAANLRRDAQGPPSGETGERPGPPHDHRPKHWGGKPAGGPRGERRPWQPREPARGAPVERRPWQPKGPGPGTPGKRTPWQPKGTGAGAPGERRPWQPKGPGSGSGQGAPGERRPWRPDRPHGGASQDRRPWGKPGSGGDRQRRDGHRATRPPGAGGRGPRNGRKPGGGGRRGGGGQGR